MIASFTIFGAYANFLENEDGLHRAGQERRPRRPRQEPLRAPAGRDRDGQGRPDALRGPGGRAETFSVNFRYNKTRAVNMKTESKEKRRSAFREYVELFAETALFVLFINTFVAQASQVPTPSMENTILVGDFLFINRMAYAQPVLPLEQVLLPATRPRKGRSRDLQVPPGRRQGARQEGRRDGRGHRRDRRQVRLSSTAEPIRTSAYDSIRTPAIIPDGRRVLRRVFGAGTISGPSSFRPGISS